MKSISNNQWKIVLFTCFLSSVVIRIGCVQDDGEQKPILSAENQSVHYNYDEKVGVNEESGENVVAQENLIPNVEVRDDIVGVLAEITSKNAGTLNDLTTDGATVVVSLPETATADLKAEAEKLTSTLNPNRRDEPKNVTFAPLEATPEIVSGGADGRNAEAEVNETERGAVNETKDGPEEIPSFSEWAQKRLEEAEKKFVNESEKVGNNGKAGSVVKLGWKNYASPDCGAKVVAANPEAVSASSVISPSREEYKLNVCTNRIWFIVELCEAIQAKKIDIANFELFSSTPKEFTVSIGDRFPSREWTTVGQFVAKDERDVQSFDLNPHLFGRYIKVEVKSHHGSQHYCPISLFRVYGVSELEVLQKEELSQTDEDDMDDDDESEGLQDGLLSKNMLNSATNAVYSMIKKAAEVLGTKSNETTKKPNHAPNVQYSPLINSCTTPSHSVVCANCTDLLFGQVFELLSCRTAQIYRLARAPFLRHALKSSRTCLDAGLFHAPSPHSSAYSQSSAYAETLLPYPLLAAVCNAMAVYENKAVLNGSRQFANATLGNTAEDGAEMGDIEASKTGIEQSLDVVLSDVEVDNGPTDELRLDLTAEVVELPKVTCSTSVEYASQIKPTKTVVLEVWAESSDDLSKEGEESVTKAEPQGGGDSPEAQVEGGEEVQEVGEEVVVVGETMDQMEHFMGEENGAVTAPPVASGSDRQKESVFLRLSNRIKALERNVSLSSQYLEELSRRYKKQVEEMQKLERTIQSMLEERKKMEDKSKQLEERLDHLIVTLEKWPSFIFWLLTTITIFCSVCWICGAERQKSHPVELPKEIQRRQSVDLLPAKEKKKVRRPSDQALKIVRSSLIAEERKLSFEIRRRKRSSNKALLKRSNSINGLDINGFKNDLIQDGPVPGQPGDWVEGNHRVIEVVNLDESENSSLDQFGTILEQEVPPYAETAVDRRARRISSQYIKPKTNGERETEGIQKSETEKNKTEENRKKEKKSFRSVLKNVFN